MGSTGMRKAAAAFAFATAIAAAVARGEVSPQKDLEQMIRETMRRNRIVGMSAVVSAGGVPLLCEGYGYADRARRIPATADSVFPLGSVTKLFTATAVMQLVEQGLVDLDAPVSRYLPELSREGRHADGPTVRQLLTHHGGLAGNIMEGFELLAPDPTEFRGLPGLLAAQPAACAPDMIFAYSNAGYGLLGCLVERVSGQPYAERVERGILAPLGMSRTRYFLAPEDGRQSVMGYEGRRETPIYPIRDVPAGAAMSCAADMERFMRFMIGGGRDGVLGREAFQEMTRRQNGGVALDGEFPIGLGYWLLEPFQADGPFVSHAGDIPPFHAVLVTMPAHGIGVFLAANSSGAASALIPLAVDLLRTVYTRQTGKTVEEPALPAKVALQTGAMDQLAGLYASPLGLLEVRRRGRRLVTTLQGFPLDLVPRESGVFTAEARLLGLLPLRIAQLEPLRIRFFEEQGRRYLRISAMGVLAGVGERFEPGVVPREWRARAGRYVPVMQSSNVRHRWPRDISLVVDDRHGLSLRYDFPGLRGTFPLEVLDAGRAVIRGKGTGLGDTLLARDEGGEATLDWSGMKLVKRQAAGCK